MAGLCPESFSKLVTLPAASVATGVNRQLPQTGLAPARTQHIFTPRSWFSALCDQAAATAPARGKQAAETVDRLPARLLYVHGD